MKVTVLTIADYVNSSGGKLTIVGAFDNFELNACPSVFTPFGVAVKILGEPSDKGKMREGHILLKKIGAKKPVFKIGFRLNFEMASKAKINAIALSVNVVGARFESFGKYRLDLSVGSRVRASTRLNVVKKVTPSLPPDKTATEG